MVAIFFSRAKAASIEMGAGCSSSTTSCSTWSFSNWPRGGSFMKKAPMATSDTGIPSRYQAQRQPCWPPAMSAMAATRTGLTRPRAWEAPCMAADMRARTPMG